MAYSLHHHCLSHHWLWSTKKIISPPSLNSVGTFQCAWSNSLTGWHKHSYRILCSSLPSSPCPAPLWTPTASRFPIQAKPRLPPGPLYFPDKLFHVLPERLSATSSRCCLKSLSRGPPWQASLAPLLSPRLFGQHQERLIFLLFFLITCIDGVCLSSWV